MSTDLFEFPQVRFTAEIVLKKQVASCAIVDSMFLDQMQNFTFVHQTIINDSNALLRSKV